MKRIYTYNNAVIQITIPDDSFKNIHKATEKFLHKVIKEKDQNDDSNQSRDIREK